MNKIESIQRIIRKRAELIAFFLKYKNVRKFIVFSTPTHGNLGDQAIALAQEEFVKYYFKNVPVFELNLIDVTRNLNLIKKNIQSNDVLFIHGGGNMGNLYPIEEDIRMKIISTFNNNKIISFPQSIYFEENANKNYYYSEMRKTYQNNIFFNLTARESVSLKKMNVLFPKNRILYTPDIVFFLTSVLKQKRTYKRKNILTLLRDDKEKSLRKDSELQLLTYLKDILNYKVDESDTQLGNDIFITRKNRDRYLCDKFDQISKYEFVITDRLHGMIFCYLTKTPCLVIQNSNPKIKATYNDWLLSCKFIAMVDESQLSDNNFIEETISEIVNSDRSNDHLQYSFYPLIDAIESNEGGGGSR